MDGRAFSEGEAEWAMTDGRRRLISTVLAALLCASGLEIVLERDDWPLSRFGMFSRVPDRKHRRVTVVGVFTDGEAELPDAVFAPLAKARLIRALGRLTASSEELAPVLEHVRRRYDERRAKRLPEGPDLLAVRLYESSWVLDPSLATLDAPRRRLLVERRFDEVAPKPGPQ